MEGRALAVSTNAADGEGAPEGAISTIFLAADKLAKDPVDAKSRNTLIDLQPQLNSKRPPYGLAPRSWAGAIEGVDEIIELVVADSGAKDLDSAIIAAAQELRALIRPYV